MADKRLKKFERWKKRLEKKHLKITAESNALMDEIVRFKKAVQKVIDEHDEMEQEIRKRQLDDLKRTFELDL